MSARAYARGGRRHHAPAVTREHPAGMPPVPSLPDDTTISLPVVPAHVGRRPARRPLASGACAWMGFGALVAQTAGPLAPGALLGGAVVATAIGAARLAPSRLAGPTGSLVAVAALGAALWGLVCGWLAGPWWMPAAAVCGLLAAVLCDCLVAPGCALAWPLSRRSFTFGLRSGGRVERWLLTPVLVGAAVLLSYPATGTPLPPPPMPGQHQTPGASCGHR